MDKMWTKIAAIIIFSLAAGTVMSQQRDKIIRFRVPTWRTGKVYDPLEEELKQQEIDEIQQRTSEIEAQRRERILARQADRRRKNLLKGLPEDSLSVLEERLTELEERVAVLEARFSVIDSNVSEDLQLR